MSQTNQNTTKANAGQNSVPKFTVETYTAPSYWASYFINGDSSGMEDDEIATADAFLAWVGLGAPVDCEDAGFCHSNDAGTLAGDCMTYSFLRRE